MISIPIITSSGYIIWLLVDFTYLVSLVEVVREVSLCITDTVAVWKF